MRRTAQARMSANFWRTRLKSSGVLDRSSEVEKDRVAMLTDCWRSLVDVRRRAMFVAFVEV